MPVLSEYDDLDGLAMAALVKRGEVTPSELLEAAITRAEARNPTLNAVIMRLYDHGRAAIAGGLPDGALRGVPYLMKDLNGAMAGVRTTRGSRFFADAVPAGGLRAHTPAAWRGVGHLWKDEYVRAWPQCHLRAALLSSYS